MSDLNIVSDRKDCSEDWIPAAIFILLMSEKADYERFIS